MIVALDPGVTTGIATYQSKLIGNDRFRAFEMDSKVFTEPHWALAQMLVAMHPTLILYEAFVFRQDKTGAVFTGVEFIGVIELVAQRYDREIKKVPTARGGFWDNKKIKAVGLYIPGKPHAMDATRLLLTWLMKNDEEWRAQTLEKLKQVL